MSTHEVWKDGEFVTSGTKKDCDHVAVWLRGQLRDANQKVAGRVGVHPIKDEEEE